MIVVSVSRDVLPLSTFPHSGRQAEKGNVLFANEKVTGIFVVG